MLPGGVHRKPETTMNRHIDGAARRRVFAHAMSGKVTAAIGLGGRV